MLEVSYVKVKQTWPTVIILDYVCACLYCLSDYCIHLNI